MVETEEYFPRGGKKPTTTYFKQSANFLGAPEKGEKKKKKPKKKSEGDDGYLSDEGTKEIDQSFKNCALGLSYKTVKEGLLILGRVKNILETKLVVSLPCRLIGSVMACHISEPYNKELEAYVNDKTEKVLELGQMFRPGQYVAVKVLEVKEVSIMLSLMPQHVNGQTALKDLQKGNLVQAAVSSVEDHGYVMDIGVPGATAFLPKANTNSEIELDVGMVCWCSIKTSPAPGGGVVTLSNELVTLQNSWLRQKPNGSMMPGSNLDFLVETPLENGIEGLVFGDTTAYVQRQHADTVRGKKPSLGQKIRARLLYVMPIRNTPFLTMKSIFDSTYPDLDSEQQLKDGQIIKEAQVQKQKPHKRKLTQDDATPQTRTKTEKNPQDRIIMDMSECTTAKHYRKKVKSLLNSINNRSKRIAKIDRKIAKMEEKGLTSETKVFHTAMQTDRIIVKERLTRLMQALNVAQEKLKEFGEDFKQDYKKEKKTAEEKKRDKLELKVVESLEPALEVPSVQEFWSAGVESVTKPVQNEEDSSSEDEEKDQPKKKRKKLTVAEKLAKVREEEERVREMERRATESENQPRSSDQFERALLANPNSSQLWIAYMAFYLQAAEIENARRTGKRALATLSFREPLEKFNVGIAMLSIECRFGTKESLQKTLEEVLQTNEPFDVHSKLLDIYVETSKHQELLALVDLMMRKYKRQTSMYTLCGAACFKLGLVDKARQVMQKAISVLEKKEHVPVLVQFALLESRSGARERAEALFEQVLAVYPARVDVCSAYVDMLLKNNDTEHVRQVMERMTSHKLPARKMKILYKKWIEVEEKIGDQEQVNKIKQQALEYIEKAKF